jgi:hypothetical protein
LPDVSHFPEMLLQSNIGSRIRQTFRCHEQHTALSRQNAGHVMKRHNSAARGENASKEQQARKVQAKNGVRNRVGGCTCVVITMTGDNTVVTVVT